ncbi:MAG: hypothetical protein EZS28_038347, partial [Streblomastix strix]
GYYLLNTDIQNLPNSANGDFAFSAESGTVWMYDQNWYNSGDIVPDQVTPASDAIPLVDSGTGVAGTSNEYSRGDHKHPLQVSDVLPSKDTSVGNVGQASSYARSDHQHPIQTVNTIPVTDSTDGSYGTVDSYTRNDHSHPINVQTNASIIPIVDGVGANGTSAYYARHDHVHPQQLTYDGNVTATKFIKSGGTNQQILLADGSNKAITDFSTSVAPRAFQIDPADGIYWMCFAILNISNYTSNGSYGCTMDINTTYVTDLFYQIKWNLRIQNGQNIRFEATQLGQYNITTDTLPTGSLFASTAIQNRFTNINGKITGVLQVNPNGNNYNQGIRIARSTNNYCGIYLACDPNSSTGTLSDQWNIAVTEAGEFRIGLGSQVVQANKGLIISADGNTLSFNGSVIAGTGASTGASNGSVNYSAGNPILWGVNSVDTNGGFYSDGPKIYWRAKPVTLGAVPP